MLRNLLNFIAVPIYKEGNPHEVSNVYSFIDKDPQKKYKLIGEMNPEEFEMFSNELRQMENEPLPFETQVYNKLLNFETTLKEDPILLKIEEEFKQLTDSKSSSPGSNK